MPHALPWVPTPPHLQPKVKGYTGNSPPPFSSTQPHRHSTTIYQKALDNETELQMLADVEEG